MLRSAGLAIIEQVAQMRVEMLALLAGGYVCQLREYALGIDPRPLVVEKEPARSYGEQNTFGADVTDEAVLISTLYTMADNLTAKVREDHSSYRTVTLKLRYNDMQDVTRSVSLEEPSDLAEYIFPLLPLLLKKAWGSKSERAFGWPEAQPYLRFSLPLRATA